MTDLVSKDPRNAWCPYYHVQVDGRMYYVYERHVFVGYGMAANLPDHSEFYLISQDAYEAETVTQGEYLCRTNGMPWHEETALVIQAIRSRRNGTAS